MLETRRLVLRPMRADDIDALLRVFGDPTVMAAFGEPSFDRTQMERWLQRNLDHQTDHGYGLFSVLQREDGILIGDCGFEMIDLDGQRVAELGYDLRSDVWGRGLATEAATAVRDYGFDVLRLPRIVCLIRTGNRASRRVAEKIGMRFEGDITRGGRRYWLYGLVPDDRATNRHPAAGDRIDSPTGPDAEAPR